MKRILIADPDPAFRKALALLIARRLDIQHVEEAADTGTLIQKLSDTSPNLLYLTGPFKVSWGLKLAFYSETPIRT